MHPKVLDFGIARVAHRDVPALEGLMAGSPYYLAPEQLDGRSVDRRSDVYSLGVVLYELLVGKKPFEGKSLEEITAAVKAGDAVPAHRVSPKIPLGLSVIASRAMAHDPDQRYPSARHLSMELRHWVDSAEARALRNDARAPAVTPVGTKIARVAVPLAAIALVGGVLAWMKLTGPAPESAMPAAASRPEALRLAAPSPSAVGIAPSAAAAEEAAAAASAAAAQSVTASAALALDSGAATAPAASAPGNTNAAPSAPAASAAEVAGAKTVVSKAEAARRRKAMAVASVTGGLPMSAVLAEGVVQLAVSPWGQVEVDGKPMGISPPLTRLTLSSGSHTITVRNTDFPAYTATVTVDGESPVTLRHRFGP
jgi:eukaryotic-like serine/threonine-protein kinase